MKIPDRKTKCWMTLISSTGLSNLPLTLSMVICFPCRQAHLASWTPLTSKRTMFYLHCLIAGLRLRPVEKGPCSERGVRAVKDALRTRLTPAVGAAMRHLPNHRVTLQFRSSSGWDRGHLSHLRLLLRARLPLLIHRRRLRARRYFPLSRGNLAQLHGTSRRHGIQAERSDRCIYSSGLVGWNRNSTIHRR